MLWVSTLTASLPSTIADIPRRPCEAITIKSHPLLTAVSMIRLVGMLVLHMHHIAFNASRLGSVFHPIEPLRCDGAHPRRV